MDATRPDVRAPQPETEVTLPDGRKEKRRRWTVWRDPMVFDSERTYGRYLEDTYRAEDPKQIKANARAIIQRHRTLTEALGDVFLFWNVAKPGLMTLYGEVGLEAFSYYLHDCPELISHALEAGTVNAIRMFEEVHMQTKASPAAPEVYFIGEDIAYKGGCMFSPSFMRSEFYPRLSRIADIIHETGKKLCFHSDGNLMDCLDDLVACGVDILNPIEVAAGMDIAEIHRQHPSLKMTGGIDVSTLLPFGTPEEVEQAAFRAIRDAGGQIMIGSSTEMHHGVPLENVLALYDAPKKMRM